MKYSFWELMIFISKTKISKLKKAIFKMKIKYRLNINWEEL